MLGTLIEKLHWFFIILHACIEKKATQLFYTGDIENINQAINIYGKYDKKFL